MPSQAVHSIRQTRAPKPAVLSYHATGACGQLVIEHKQQSACSQEVASAGDVVDIPGQGGSSSSSKAIKDIEELGRNVAAVSMAASKLHGAAAAVPS